MSTITDATGNEIDFDAAVNLMDDTIRETLHDAIGDTPATEQEFFNMYAAAHMRKFGEPFQVN